MKNLSKWALVAVGVAVMLAGCASAPTAFERKFYDIETNRVERLVVVTNVVPVYVTNVAVVVETNRATGEAGGILVTNAAVAERWETNLTLATNFVESYVFTPNTNADSVSNAVGRVTGVFGFPFGDLVGLLVGGLFGVWGYLRSAKAQRVAGVLAQVIETGRAVLQTTPQGQKLDEQWKVWMVKHQAEAGVIQEVVALLGKVVDSASAKEAAGKLVEKLRVES